MPSLPRRICVAAAVTLITGSSLIPVPPTTSAAALTTTSGQPASHTIAGGDSHTCMVNADTTVSCWGENDRGQLGDGTTTDSVSPVLVVGLADVVEVTTASNHSCARTKSGQAFCWGTGQGLGNGTGADSPTPVAVSGLIDAQSIAVNGYHSCAARTSGTVVCWGDNSYGELGDGTFDSSDVTVEVVGVAGAVSVGLGDNYSYAGPRDGIRQVLGRELLRPTRRRNRPPIVGTGRRGRPHGRGFDQWWVQPHMCCAEDR